VIKRTDTPVMSHVNKERGDDKARKAIYLVSMMRHDFPEWNGSREILVRTGGPPPGTNVRCILETKCISEDEGQYIVTLTKT